MEIRTLAGESAERQIAAHQHTIDALTVALHQRPSRIEHLERQVADFRVIIAFLQGKIP